MGTETGLQRVRACAASRGALPSDVREWGETARRKSREPVFEVTAFNKLM